MPEAAAAQVALPDYESEGHRRHLWLSKRRTSDFVRRLQTRPEALTLGARDTPEELPSQEFCVFMASSRRYKGNLNQGASRGQYARMKNGVSPICRFRSLTGPKIAHAV